jgi:16S rRNA (guanine(966)-N(2))-methyltransferase RsmD
MRVIAGELKGRRLVTPRGRTTRPTADQVRIACLDTLMPYIGAGPFLDLVAGAGGVGIEALSRGAPFAVFVEDDAQALRALNENLTGLGLGGRTRVMRADAVRALDTLTRDAARFAVVFLDPPYDSPRAALVLGRLEEGTCLEPGAVVVAQHPTKAPIGVGSGGLRLWKTRRFGETTLTFLRGPD